MTVWMRLPTDSMSNAVKDTHIAVCIPLLATKLDLSKSTLPALRMLSPETGLV